MVVHRDSRCRSLLIHSRLVCEPTIGGVIHAIRARFGRVWLDEQPAAVRSASQLTAPLADIVRKRHVAPLLKNARARGRVTIVVGWRHRMRARRRIFFSSAYANGRPRSRYAVAILPPQSRLQRRSVIKRRRCARSSMRILSTRVIWPQRAQKLATRRRLQPPPPPSVAVAVAATPDGGGTATTATCVGEVACHSIRVKVARARVRAPSHSRRTGGELARTRRRRRRATTSDDKRRPHTRNSASQRASASVPLDVTSVVRRLPRHE